MPNNIDRRFPTPRPAPAGITDETTAQECFDWYCHRSGMSEHKVCTLAQINQPWVNKVLRGAIKTNDIDKLINLCLVLRLSPAETADFLARIERALSPANMCHRAYLELLAIGCGEQQVDVEEDLSDPRQILEHANRYLRERGYPELPSYL